MLPLSRITRSTENRYDHDGLAFGGKVNCVGKLSGKSAANAGTQLLISKWMGKNSQVSRAKLIQKLQAQSRLFAFVPIERGFDINLDGGSSFESILLHLDFWDSRSMTSKAGRAAEGFSR